MLNLASCIVFESISISDNFVENFKKVTKLTHKGGGGGEIKLIVKKKNKSIEPSVKQNLVSKNECNRSNCYVVVCFGSLRV